LTPLFVLGALVFAIRLVQASPRAPLQVPENWPSELVAALEAARAEGKPLHLHLTRPDVPLAPKMDETLKLAPLQQLLAAHFVELRLDSRQHAELFRSLLGVAGVLGSCVIDVDAAGRPDVVSVLVGAAETDRYVTLLDDTARSLSRLRQLRDGPRQPAGQLELAELYAAQGSVARARAELESCDDVALRASVVEHLARLDVEAGQTARARARLEQIRDLVEGPALPRLPLTKGLILSAERRVSQAVEVLGAALPAQRDSNERDQSLLLLAQLEHELKRDQRALAYLEQVPSGSRWARRAADSIVHIRNPSPGHQH
jgi:tetratricopeptide (TPR) repeat protein